MNSISPECQELKVQYDACFNRWFKEKFLKGQTDDASCADLFASYQSCVKVVSYVFQLQIRMFKNNGHSKSSD